ncbi:hypothetical protein DNHGIG_40080 [Collibacillus ludicampi]|uniref:Uncharacterized protein n=1 Tax=Collibacillus ludicampi TaxID=2771369 RepID=A0AAV4LMS6_9BACL|nr:hypothetical protein [Collibacillus ludicampi]GIM48459.1 hypothetical protein DNHGIG_40080 [Collibacillus ludicampi]
MVQLSILDDMVQTPFTLKSNDSRRIVRRKKLKSARLDHQLTFDELDWVVIYPVPKTNKQLLQEARENLIKMLNQCDLCPFRKTQNDVRAEECWSCTHRLKMEEVAKNVEFLMSKIRKERRKMA